MGRKTTPEAAPIAGQFIAATATPTVIAAQIDSTRERQQLVVAEFGDGLPWHPDHYESAIRQELGRGFEALLRAGRYLIVARECAEHGDWAGILGRLNLDRSQASRLMEASRRIANVATSQRLLEATGTQSKLFELLTLDSEQFSALAEDGEAGGITLDDVATMSVKELRAALRESREDIIAKDERLRRKEESLERKEKAIRALKKERDKATPEETAALLRDACTRAALSVRADIEATGDVASLARTFAELMAHDDSSETGAFLGGLVGEAMIALRRLRDVYGLPIINDDAQA
jgi:hypothetical protein